MFQKLTAVGRLGKDPEVRHSANGAAIANFSIACSEKRKDKDTGELKEDTEWINCVAFSRLAEIVQEWVTKGSLVLIEGKLKTRKYTDKNGIERQSTEVILSEMKMLGSSRTASEPKQTQTKPKDTASPARNGATPPAFDQFDDDIPF